VAQREEQRSRESHPTESAFQISHHRDADHGIDPQGDFAEPVVAQGVPQCKSKNQQRIAQMTENVRETLAENLTALGRSEWRTKTGMEPCARRQRENASATKNGKNGVNH